MPAPATIKVTSGTTAKATTADTAVEVIATQGPARTFRHARLINEGAVAGFWSADGGSTWSRLPAATVITDDDIYIRDKAVQVKRVAGGSDLSGIWGEIW